jgi:hypothetical protein
MSEEEKKKTEQKGEEGNISVALHQINDQILSVYRKQQMMYQWGVKFLTIFNDYKTRDVIRTKFPKNMRKELTIEALKSVGKYVDELLC